MANTMQFDLVSPEKRLASLEAVQVEIPAAEGDMTAMAEHAPVITTLRPGLVTVTGADGQETRFAVTGGFAEINARAVSLLAEHATADFSDRTLFQSHLEDARARAARASGEDRDVADKLVADMVQLLDAMA
ncbi:MAG: ATP synthase F1 subunit epsilon [Tropicimonas sp.]|uniref:ATP synthase F1 subunit epsilon n=1 Tax=Tropicimonas sp. TaxID=2067044 RepID=UPI003A84C558